MNECAFYLLWRNDLATYNLVPLMQDGVIKTVLYRFLSKWPWRTTCADNSICDSKQCVPQLGRSGAQCPWRGRGSASLEPMSDSPAVYVHICVCMHMCEGILCIILLVFLIIIIRVARIAGVKTVYSGTQNKGEEWWRLQKVFVSASCWYLQSFIYYKYEDL